MTETFQEKLDRGAQLHRQGLFAEAAAIYQQALAEQPDHHAALNLLGVVSSQTGRHEQALTLIRRAIQISPLPQYHRNLGLALAATGRFAEAAAAQRQSLALDPMSLAANIALGNALLEMDQSQQAAMAFQRCLSLQPDDTAALLGLGSALYQTGEFDEALARLDRAIERQADLALAHMNRGLILLTRGDFEGGWPEFEWRWKTPIRLARQQALGKPMWDGSDLNGRRILIHGEVGGGDTLNFARYIPLVAQRGGKVIFTCQPPLLGLLRQVPGVERFMEPLEALPEFDVHCSLISLAAVFRTNLASVPPQVPLLAADPAAAERWRSRMPHDGRLKVGLAWAGNAYPLSRSMPLAMLEPLAGVPNLWLCSLQKGEAAQQLAGSPLGAAVVDWTEELKDFSDTAALMANLDLVISVDTSVVHLAGAMGKRAWVMLKTVPDFRWMMERSDSPWYPSMRLFRQKKAGDWRSVVEQVVQSF